MADRPKITTDHLLAYIDGELDASMASQVETNVENDPEAAATLRRYRQVRSLTAADDSIAPPADVIERARAIFQPRTQGQRLGEWLRSLEETIASLTFDSRLQPAAVRYADTGERFHLSYEVDDAEVDLQFDRTQRGDEAKRDGERETWRLMGQITGESAMASQPFAIRRSGGEIIVDSEIDERDMFSAELPPGRYDVLIGQGESVICLTDIELE